MSTSAYISAIIIGLIRLVASLCLTYLMVHFGRRSLYLASALGTILSLATFSTILLLSEHLSDWELGIPQTALSWLSLVSACCLVFSVNLGVQPMPLLMSSELYPSDLRAFCKVWRKPSCLYIKIYLYISTYFYRASQDLWHVWWWWCPSRCFLFWSPVYISRAASIFTVALFCVAFP